VIRERKNERKSWMGEGHSMIHLCSSVAKLVLAKTKRIILGKFREVFKCCGILIIKK
jgi:hypothetical protein